MAHITSTTEKHEFFWQNTTKTTYADPQKAIKITKTADFCGFLAIFDNFGNNLDFSGRHN